MRRRKSRWITSSRGGSSSATWPWWWRRCCRTCRHAPASQSPHPILIRFSKWIIWHAWRRRRRSRRAAPARGPRGESLDIIGWIPSFGGLFFTLVAFVIALSVIVAVHEYGHYIVGRWSGIHAEVFSLGFGPVIFSRVDRRGTRWQVAALPFGGYVKFLGDADAASGKDAEAMAELNEVAQRRTMHGAPLWARSATVAAGPVFNFIMSILIFAGFFIVQGVAVERPVVGALPPLPAAAQGLVPGDLILGVEGRATPDNAAFFEAVEALEPQSSVTYDIERAGAARVVEGPFPFPPLAGSVQPQSAARDAGLQAGDVILAVDGQPIHAFAELRELV